MKVSICPKCKTKELINELKKRNFDLKIECINYCGIGRNKYVALVDNKPIIFSDKDKFILEIEKLDNSNNVC